MARWRLTRSAHPRVGVETANGRTSHGAAQRYASAGTPQLEITIVDPMVSGEHAQLRWDDGRMAARRLPQQERDLRRRQRCDQVPVTDHRPGPPGDAVDGPAVRIARSKIPTRRGGTWAADGQFDDRGGAQRKPAPDTARGRPAGGSHDRTGPRQRHRGPGCAGLTPARDGPRRADRPRTPDIWGSRQRNVRRRRPGTTRTTDRRRRRHRRQHRLRRTGGRLVHARSSPRPREVYVWTASGSPRRWSASARDVTFNRGTRHPTPR